MNDISKIIEYWDHRASCEARTLVAIAIVAAWVCALLAVFALYNGGYP